MRREDENKRLLQPNLMVETIYNLLKEISNDSIIVVITGSWGIQFVAGKKLASHNDIDAQIFYPENPPLLRDKFFSLVELTYHKLIQREVINDREMVIKYTIADEEIEVPIVRRRINCDNFEFDVWVKSLEYQIATWAIRISGLAQRAKRELELRDLIHFSLLVENQFDRTKVLDLIREHYQTPKDVSPEFILDLTLQKLR